MPTPVVAFEAGRRGSMGAVISASHNPYRDNGIKLFAPGGLKLPDAIERRIDLHGTTQDDAHAALDRFIRLCWKDGRRMLLVITGKGSGGEGVLRRGVPRWLAAGEHAARILKVETAQARHGGGGAFYVLLRRQRDRA